jgi:ATP-binding cassette, subfamily B, heavy metal transporter
MSIASDTPAPPLPDRPAHEATGWATVRKVGPYLWPPGETGVKVRVVTALALLVIAKLIAVGTPLIYRAAVDALAPADAGTGWLVGVGAVGLTVAYGMARLLNVGFQQLRDAVFAVVGQRALRRLALETFTHIHRLSLRYHLTRKTGGLSRIIERGVKGVDFLLRFLLFSIGPLVLELLLIAGRSSSWCCSTRAIWRAIVVSPSRSTSGSPSRSPNGG